MKIDLKRILEFDKSLSNPGEERRLRAIIMDLYPDCKAEMNAILDIYKSGIIQRICMESTITSVMYERFIVKLMNEYGLQRDYAVSGLEAWIEGLGLENKIQESKATDKYNSQKTEPYNSINNTAKRNKENPIKRRNVITVLAVASIIIFAVIGVFHYCKGKVKVPFDPKEISEEDYMDLRKELENAGFTNVSEIPDKNGWLKSGKVTNVTIGGTSWFFKGFYFAPDVEIIISYSSMNRKNITNIVNDWEEKDYDELQADLENNGFTNISIEKVETSKKEEDKKIALLYLNDKIYSNEKCYLPQNASITIAYYALQIEIGSDNTQFIGREYTEVVEELTQSGFRTVQTQKTYLGWSKGNSVINVTVNGTEDFSSFDVYDSDVVIVVKYSSNDRIDATEIFEDIQAKQFSQLQRELKEAGFTNVSFSEIETTNTSENLFVSYITINDEQFDNGECYIKSSAPIKIYYYVLSICIGKTPSSIKGMQYKDVVDELEEMGFTNITLLRSDDLFNGVVNKEGSIKRITINGDNDFTETDMFRFDIEIIIVVYTYKGKGCEDITEVEN